MTTEPAKPQQPPSLDLGERVDFLRLDASRKLDPERKASLGQFLTPAPVAQLMASMADYSYPVVRILDPGAGIGSLFAACVAELCNRTQRPREIRVTAYEIEPMLAEYIRETFELCRSACERAGIRFAGEVVEGDFIESAARLFAPGLFAQESPADFTLAILNPPYGKIRTDSRTRQLLRDLGVETPNVYTGFLAAAIRLLQPNGELAAITPRSFCNGVYFRKFRKFFLSEMTIRRAHVFDSRRDAFRDDGVLQENLILHAVKRHSEQSDNVNVTSSTGSDEELHTSTTSPYAQVVDPKDPESFIRIVADDLGQRIADHAENLRARLGDLELTVSTGRVVDFRARDLLRKEPGERTVPLIYPTHFAEGYVRWPKPGSRKPNAILGEEARQRGLLVPNENYVLVRRFSAKEERRRIVAAVYDAERLPGEYVGFENHLNYFHRNGGGISITLARGLAAFLNSTLADAYFRQFSGHTQVNAVDLRSIRYPALTQLESIGQQVGAEFPNQDELDQLVERELGLSDGAAGNPMRVKKRIDESLAVLRALGFPRAQINERSALVLLALVGIKPDDRWSDASDPLMGTTPIMEFAAEHYGKTYAPNTRETVRRQTMHQFVDAGLAVANPDQPDRATNSPNFVYQIERGALELLRSFGSDEWDANLNAYLTSVETLSQRYAQEREMERIPVRIAEGQPLTLSAGGQNILIKQVIEDFASRFVPGDRLLYVGDTGEKFVYFEREVLADLGVQVEVHGKMPDVIIYDEARNWLVLIEAVTSHGPVNPKRHGELKRLFQNSRAGLVFVTAFLTRKAMVSYLNDISWETEVWVADSPSHLIHFNGERFLGPH